MKLWVAALLIGLPLTLRAASASKIRLEPFVDDVEFPVYLTHDGTSRLFILEHRGRIRLVVGGRLQAAPYLDIRDRVKFGGECGLLGLAFHPQFTKNGRYFVNYTTTREPDGLSTRISEFRDGTTTERVLLR